MSMLPATPTARRREEEARERARTEALDTMENRGGAQASPSPTPPSPAPGPAHSLALAIGQDRIYLPPAVSITRTLTEEGEEMATHIGFMHVTLSVEEAVSEGVLELNGRFHHDRAQAVLRARPQPGQWLHPFHPAAKLNVAGRMLPPETKGNPFGR